MQTAPHISCLCAEDFIKAVSRLARMAVTWNSGPTLSIPHNLLLVKRTSQQDQEELGITSVSKRRWPVCARRL